MKLETFVAFFGACVKAANTLRTETSSILPSSCAAPIREFTRCTDAGIKPVEEGWGPRQRDHS